MARAKSRTNVDLATSTEASEEIFGQMALETPSSVSPTSRSANPSTRNGHKGKRVNRSAPENSALSDASGKILGKVVKSNSHCDYVVQLDDDMSTSSPPQPGEFGFGSFVKLANGDRPPIVGIIYNSQLVNPTFLNNGPRLSSEPDPVFAPDLIHETRTLLGVVLIGTLENIQGEPYGAQNIPRDVVPVNAAVSCMGDDEIHRFHLDSAGKPQFCYYSLLLRYGGSFAAHLTEQVLQELIALQVFQPKDQRALEILCKELTWRNTMGTLR